MKLNKLVVIGFIILITLVNLGIYMNMVITNKINKIESTQPSVQVIEKSNSDNITNNNYDYSNDFNYYTNNMDEKSQFEEFKNQMEILKNK